MQHAKISSLRPEGVVVVRALRGLGDMLCCVPALRALRAAMPGAHVTLLGLPWARPFRERFCMYLDEFLEFPGFPGIPERPFEARALTEFLRDVQTRQFDLALQMQGSGTHSNAFTQLLGAAICGGYYLGALYCPDPEHFLPYDQGQPEVRRWLALVEHLGFPSAGDHLEFPIGASDLGDFEELPEAALLESESYVCLHPGAFEARRRWPALSFAAVGDALAERGLQVVITGSSEEAGVAAEVAAAMRFPAVDLAGRTSLGALAVLLAGSRLLVCNDTGVSHLADALGLPSVVVFVASEPGRWAPLDGSRHRALGVAPGIGPGDGDGPARGASCGAALRCLRGGCLHLQEMQPSRWGRQPTTGEVVAEADDLLNSGLRSWAALSIPKDCPARGKVAT